MQCEKLKSVFYPSEAKILYFRNQDLDDTAMQYYIEAKFNLKKKCLDATCLVS